MGIWAAIQAILVSLPKLLELAERLGAIMADKKFNDWVSELDNTVRSLENAKSLQDRVGAARRLNDLVRRMSPRS